MFPKYGYRKVTRQLQREGNPVNHKKVLRIMREKGLLVKKSRWFIKTTDINHPYPVYPNLIKDLKVTKVNQVCVADITYVQIVSVFVYLTVILDLCSHVASPTGVWIVPLNLNGNRKNKKYSDIDAFLFVSMVPPEEHNAYLGEQVSYMLPLFLGQLLI